MGLQFDDDEPAEVEASPKRVVPKPETKPKTVIKTKEVSLFTDAELQVIAKACHDYRKSHKRAEKWDPLTSLEGKAYRNAGIIIEKIGEFLEGI